MQKDLDSPAGVHVFEHKAPGILSDFLPSIGIHEEAFQDFGQVTAIQGSWQSNPQNSKWRLRFSWSVA